MATTNTIVAGSLQLIIGPMFSGKSTELMRLMRRHALAKKKCLVIKYSKDVRYTNGNEVCSHDGVTFPAIPCNELGDVATSSIEKCDVLGIDEGQFYPDIEVFVEKWANEGKVVIVAALDSTYERKPFGSIPNLVPLADSVKKLSAVCKLCAGEAAFTKRRLTESLSNAVEIIGGDELYMAVCRTCFFRSDFLSLDSVGKL